MVLLIIGLAATGFFFSRGSQSNKNTGKVVTSPVLPMEPVKVVTQSVQKENLISGTIEPETLATITSEVSRRMMKRYVNLGDFVREGELLAELDTEQQEVAIQQAKAAHNQAISARLQAESDYARSLVETQSAKDQAEAQLRQAQAGNRQAKAQTSLADANARKVKRITRVQELRQAEAALSRAKSDEKLAKIESDRYTKLVQEGAASQQSLDHALAALERATAQRVAAEQAVLLAEEGARQEDIEAAQESANAAAAQVSVTTAQIDAAQATVRTAGTRDLRLAAIRRQIDALRAQEKQTLQGVRQAEIGLKKHRLVAPFTGRILAVLADTGDLVAPGTPIFRLGTADDLKAVFAIPEASRLKLETNQKVTLRLDALPDKTFAATIRRIGFQADPKTRTFPLEVRFVDKDSRILPNMVARLLIPIGEVQKLPLVPIKAVASDAKGAFVYRLDGERVVRRDVVLGSPLGNRVVVVKGVSAGDVVAASPQRLSEGAKVRLVTGR